MKPEAYTFMSAGYSTTPLVKKLGIKDETRVMLIDAPKDYDELLGAKIKKVKSDPDLVHLFAKDYKSFFLHMRKLDPVIEKNKSIVIWVSWYKKTSGIKTDINEDAIREYALEHSLVDVKVCAVSDVWSGLKLVVPLKRRKQ